ncbi:hypothetical protein VNO78_12362 [Psophocarpus tetragonolobus]|uniref:Uncharacterized protein n=1 Tax=Psophocarpus tetragonolobus TaxID=3891 RepID=A0AAN9XPG8_PSOTE
MGRHDQTSLELGAFDYLVPSNLYSASYWFLDFDPLTSSRFRLVRTRCWTDDLYFTIPPVIFIYSRSDVYCDGAIHWNNGEGNYGLYFDVVLNQRLNTYPMPPYIQNRCVGYFVESRSHLHMVLLSYSENLVDILGLKEDYSDWFVLFRIDFHSVAVFTFPERDKWVCLFKGWCIVREEREEDYLIVAIFQCVYVFELRQELQMFHLFQCILVRSRGYLHMVLVPYPENLIDVFELKEDYSDWSVLFRIDLHSVAVYAFPETNMNWENWIPFFKGLSIVHCS